MILKLGMEHVGLKGFKLYLNDDTSMTLTYFMEMSKCSLCVYTETVRKSFKGILFQANAHIDNKFMFI